MAIARTRKGWSSHRQLIGLLAGCAFVAGLTTASALASPRPWEVAPTRVPDACSAPPAAANVPLTHGPNGTPPTLTPTPTFTATGTPTRTPTSTPSPTGTFRPWFTPVVTCGVVGDAITLSDPIQVGRVALDGVVSACYSGQSCPGRGSLDPLHYDAYSFTNS